MAEGPVKQSVEDKAKALSNLPLFMKELPQGEIDEASAFQLDALKSLLYEGDAEGESSDCTCTSCAPHPCRVLCLRLLITLASVGLITSCCRETERAQNFKAQANDNFRAKKFKEALQFYTQGLGDLSPELHEETKRTLWCNRAACHLELGSLFVFSSLARSTLFKVLKT